MRYVWGPLSPLGLGVAGLTLIADQVHKAWMLYVYDIGAKGTVRLALFFDLILVWNQGVSYGLFQQQSSLGRWALILFAFASALALVVWLARITSPLSATCIGLIIGCGLLLAPRLRLRMVRVQHCRYSHRCGGGRTSV